MPVVSQLPFVRRTTFRFRARIRLPHKSDSPISHLRDKRLRKKREETRVLFSFSLSLSLSLFHGPEDQNSVHVAHGRVAHRCGARPKERRVREMVETDFARHDCRARRRTRAVDRLVGTTETTESER